MAEPIWGLQALIASKTRPIDKDMFLRVIDDHEELLLGNPIAEIAGVNEVDILVSLVVACYRLANYLGIGLDDEVRKLFR